MQSFFNSVQAVVLILIMTAVGYVFGKLGYITAKNKSVIQKLIINIAVPCMCITNIFAQFSRELLFDMGTLIIVPLASVMCSLSVSLLLAGLLKISPKRRGGFIVMCSFSNAIFVGLPVCRELFGENAVPAVMFYYLVNSTLFWTVGNAFIQKSGGEGKKLTVKQTFKAILSPPLVTMMISIILLLFNFRMPDIILKFSGYFGSTVTPLALVYIGFAMYETGIKNIRLDRSYIAVIALRFVVAPLSAFVIAYAMGAESMITKIFVVESSMPVMVQSVVVAAAADADEHYLASGMSITTIACFVFIPILMQILNMI